MSDPLIGFAEDLRQEVLGRASVDGAEQMRSEVFTEHIVEMLIEVGELENAVTTFHRARGVEVHGYGIDDGDTLNLIAVRYTGQIPPGSLSRTDVDTAMRRLITFWERCRDTAYHEELEPSSPAYDMAEAIHRAVPDIRRLRLVLATDTRSNADQLSVRRNDELEERRILWDIVRLHRLETSGREREPIEVDFVARFGRPLPCLPGPGTDEDYRAMLAVVPGEWLADIYEEHGARLLELNVRSFLQAAGKINRGIRDTLRGEPERFLAYNNGISATAAAVDLVDIEGGGTGIAAIRDLQIVNGGQTTASVHRAMLGRVDLSEVAVQAKITVAAPGRLQEIVPLISRYANSQNKVSEADLTANEPYHVEIEKLSRATWTPVVDGATRQTHWFYERARGQYRDAAFRAGTPARQREFKIANPADQRFGKTDLAKYEHAWDQIPQHVSRGAQKNFTTFMSNLARRHVVADRDHFERVVAKAQLWKRAEKLVSAENFGGYRANIVAYSIAKLSHSTSQRLNLPAIWQRQALTPATEEALVVLAHLAWQVLVEQAPAGINITEWAKRDECWHRMRAAAYDVPTDLAIELVTAVDTGRVAPERKLDELGVRVAAAGGAGWLALHNWAKQTGNLESWQRKLASDVSRRLLSGRPPTAKQSEWAAPILDEAARLGFEP